MSLPPSVKCPPLLIYAHKVDLISRSSTPVSKLAVERVKTILERELEKRRLANVGGVGVEGLGAENEEAQMGGLDCQGETFKFDKWEGGEIDFASGWVKVVRTDMEQKVDEKPQEEEVDSLGDLKDWMDGLR